ncbi:MAG: DMT family transporter [Roseococcus sp.]|nr:DMT family transporter [Roseococcus sp.]
MSPDPSAPRRRAILAVLGAALLFALAAACVKALGGAIPLAQLVFFRSVLALPLLLPLLLAAGGLAALRTTRPMGHLFRTLFGLGGMLAAFYGYATLPLAMVTALGFTMPLFLALLAAPLLGERPAAVRLAAALAGFAGVVLMLRPWRGDAPPTLPVLVVLAGALAWALAMITIRRLGAAGESGVAIVLWFALGSSVLSLFAALPVWVWPDARQWALLLGVGVVSALAQLLMTEAYRKGETTLVAPFEYSGILWTTLLGLLLWAEAPDGWDALGVLVLIGAGLALWRLDARGR